MKKKGKNYLQFMSTRCHALTTTHTHTHTVTHAHTHTHSNYMRDDNLQLMAYEIVQVRHNLIEDTLLLFLTVTSLQ